MSRRKGKNKKPKGRRSFRVSDAFLASYEWRALRMRALVKYGARCQCCGATRKNGVQMHVDHIQPRREFPALALDLDNLQVLCEVCNHGKGNWDATDWRGPEPVSLPAKPPQPEKREKLPPLAMTDEDACRILERQEMFPRLVKKA